MNRRDFLKIAKFGLLGVMFPNIDLDYSGGEMELSEIFAKIANNELLNPYEMEFLKSQGRDTQNRNSRMAQWTGADGNPQFINPIIDTPVWKGSILSSCIFKFEATVPSSADLSSGVSVYFTKYGTSKVFEVDPSTSTRILINTKNNFAFMGFGGWEENAVGTRRLGYNLLNKDGQAAGITFSVGYPITMSATTTGQATGSFFMMVDRTIEGSENASVAKLVMSSFQSSGSNLLVGGIVGLMEV